MELGPNECLTFYGDSGSVEELDASLDNLFIEAGNRSNSNQRFSVGPVGCMKHGIQ